MSHQNKELGLKQGVGAGGSQSIISLSILGLVLLAHMNLSCACAQGLSSFLLFPPVTLTHLAHARHHGRACAGQLCTSWKAGPETGDRLILRGEAI